MTTKRTTTRTRRPATRKTQPKQSPELRGIDLSSFFADDWSGVTPQTAIRVTSILACVRFIAQSIASCPVHVMRSEPGGRRSDARDLPIHRILSRYPNGWMSAYEWVELMAKWTALWGNAYSRIVSGPTGFIESLVPLHPSRVTPKLVGQEVFYEYFGPDGASRVYSQSQVLHFRWLSDNGYQGLVPADLCGTAVGLARKLDLAAMNYWDNSARPDVVLETDETIPEQAVQNLRQQWKETYGGPRNRGKTAILPKKMKVSTIASNSNEASQFMELRSAIVGEVARAFGIPSTLIGDSAMAKYSNVEQEFLSAQVFLLLPWQRRFEGAIDRSILASYGDDVYCKLDDRGLLRGDTAARAALYQSLFNMGAISPNEIRRLEDFDQLEDQAANETYMQLGFSTLGQAAQQIGGANVQ